VTLKAIILINSYAFSEFVCIQRNILTHNSVLGAENKLQAQQKTLQKQVMDIIDHCIS